MMTDRPGTTARRGTSSARGIILLVLCAAQFMLIVDVVVVNVAIPSIRNDLSIPDTRIQLTGIAYTLTFGSLLIVFGRAGDLLGRRGLFLGGLALFTLASLCTGIATSSGQLFAGRALQGVGAAMVSPNALALLTAHFEEGARRNRALGIWAAVGAGGAISGQLIGGVLTHLAGWRWVFLVNLPIGVVVLFVAARVLARSRAARRGVLSDLRAARRGVLSDLRAAEHRGRLDLGGALLLTAGLALGVLALSRVAEQGLGAGVAVPAALAALVLAAFVRVEHTHPEPMLRLSFLRKPGPRIGNLTLAANAGALGAGLFFTTLYLQTVLGYSPLQVGAAFAPITLLIMAISPVAGRLVGTLGVRRLLPVGLGVLGAGMIYLARVPVDGSYWVDVLPGMLLLAVGSGLAFAPTFVAGTAGLEPDEHGLASGLLNSSQELGAAVGLAVLASLAAAVTGAAAGSASAALTAGYRAGFAAAAVIMLAAAAVALTAPRGLGAAPPQQEPAPDLQTS